MKQKRQNLGFTMTEMLAVIALLAVVSALVFVAAAHYQRLMYQKEVDGYAKELYVAAQNHLSIANSQGLLRTEHGDGSTWPGDAGAGIYHYVYPADSASFDNRASDLSLMLPYASIDDTLRVDGSYVIRYRYDPEKDIAAVLDVFYANPNAGFLFSQFGHSFSKGEYRGLADYRGEGDDKAEQRRAYPDGGQAVIGWYGGDQDGVGKVVDSDKLAVEVENAERLVAWVTQPDGYEGGLTKEQVTLELSVRGETSGASAFVPLDGLDAQNRVTAGGVVVSAIPVVLDDITEAGGHFANLFPVEEGFIPGENLELRAYALPNAGALVDGKLPAVTAGKSAHANSLFDSVVTMPNDDAGDLGATRQVALVSNIRHLENLSDGISGFNPIAGALPDSYPADADAAQVLADWREFAPTGAQQTVDLALVETTDPLNPTDDRSWPGFMNKIAGVTGGSPAEEALAAASVRVHDVFGDESGASAPGTFMPVNPSYPLRYDGLGHRIWGVVVGNSSTAGLFATVTGGDLRNLELVSFDIATTGGDAGALAGRLAGTTVSGVLARNQVETDGPSPAVSGTGSVGGLVGSLDGGSIDRCAAAVLVRSAGGAAGGLVGDAGAAPVTSSYSGGHTVGGAYDAGNCNVESPGAAGGLVGTTAGGIVNCYSTCSASGSTVGGLVGASSGGISNCYALGLVAGAGDGATRGALAGVASGPLSGDRYLEIVNGIDVSPVGSNPGAAGVSAIDETAGTFNDFARLGTGDAAQASPYDGTLVRNYSVGGEVYYLYRNIVQLGKLADAGFGLPDDGSFQVHMLLHYGDWPSPETLVVNKR